MLQDLPRRLARLPVGTHVRVYFPRDGTAGAVTGTLEGLAGADLRIRDFQGQVSTIRLTEVTGFTAPERAESASRLDQQRKRRTRRTLGVVPVDVIFNPILDYSYDGLKNLDFAPATRVAYNVSPAWALAVEEYDDFGPLHQLYGSAQQAHQLYAVVNHRTRAVDIEAGVGLGLTDATDQLTLKLILSRDLN